MNQTENIVRPAVQYPAQRKNMMWVAAEVGKPETIDNVLKVEFPNEKLCQEACNIVNEYFGYSPEEISQSLKNTK
jgi:hypothetical protein